MNLLIGFLFVFNVALVLGYSSCPKGHYGKFNLEKYNNENIESYGVFTVPRDQVQFRLWTRDQTNVFAPLYYGHLRDEETIRPQKPFKFIIHGWSDCADAEWYEYLTKEFLKKDDYNVIQVDWAKPAGALYPVSAGYTKDVAKYVGELIVDLNNTLGVPFENVHLIGHSLGAHISGFAGKYVDKHTRKIIGKITGMDPAGPLYLLATPGNRLSTHDAHYVEIIHTDGGKFGYKHQLGHVDFYPNGGDAPQPGCVLFESVVDVASCSHTRAYWLFGESINSKDFIASECGSIKKYKHGDCVNSKQAIIGENNNVTTNGEFYLTTNNKQPFARCGII